MLYTDNRLRKTMYCSYIEQEVGKKNLIYLSVFLALITVGVHSLLQTLSDTVLTSALPQLMLPSNYTVAYTLNLFAYIFFVVFFISKYDRVTFTQITKNKWYLLVKMGANPNRLIVRKAFNTLVSVFTVYTVAYVLSLVISIFFKYTFVIGYLISLFVAGLTDILFLVWSVMFVSLFVKERRRAGLIIIGIVALQTVLKAVTGFFTLTASRSLMTDIANIFDPAQSPYILILLVFCFAAIVTTAIIASHKAAYYTTAHDSSDITKIDYKTKKLIAPKSSSGKAAKILGIAFKSILGAVVAVAVAANVFVLVMSLSSSTDEFSVYGYIPYIVQSSTMEPDIYKNDLVIFRRVDTAMPVEVGKVIIFKQDDTVYIEKISAVNDVMYTVDITNYPKSAKGDELVKYVVRSEIYGELTYTNRWLGALILFANSLIGQILLFILPAVLIFFYKPIFDFFKKVVAVKRN